MKQKHIQISPEVMAVLQASTITETALKLPPGQLERKLYEAVNKVLATAGGKWSRTAQAHVFTTDPRAVLGLALETGKVLDKKKTYQAFYTPADVARQLAQFASVEGKRTLEPSCGAGALVGACLEAGASLVHAIDIDPDAVKATDAAYASTGKVLVTHGDFMKHTPGMFPRIVMNPPFTANQDVAHVTRALKFLEAGGRLCSVMFGDPEARPRYAKLVKDLMWDGYKVQYTLLGEGAFASSGTEVATSILIVDAPTSMAK